MEYLVLWKYVCDLLVSKIKFNEYKVSDLEDEVLELYYNVDKINTTELYT